MATDNHQYRPATMRDGSKACGDCYGTPTSHQQLTIEELTERFYAVKEHRDKLSQDVQLAKYQREWFQKHMPNCPVRPTDAAIDQSEKLLGREVGYPKGCA